MDGKEKVSYKLLCNACLCVGQGLNLITDVKLKGFYLDALNEISLCNIADITPVLCWDCEALLRRAMLFKKQVKDSYQILLTYTSENFFSNVSRTPRLCVKTNDTITILPDDELCRDYVEIVESDSLTIKNEVKIDWEFNRGTGLTEMTESLELRPDRTQQVYLKEDLKEEFNGNGDDLDHDADCDYQPDVLTDISKRKRNKKAIKKRLTKSLKNIKEKKLKTKKEAKDQELKILTIELSYEDMMIERDKEMTKETYLNSEYKCETCIMGFNYYKSYKTHLTVKHSEDIGEYSCPVCKTIHVSVDSFTAHYKRHMRRYECSLCQKRTMDLKVMQQHYFSTHEISLKEYKCDDCGKISK